MNIKSQFKTFDCVRRPLYEFANHNFYPYGQKSSDSYDIAVRYQIKMIPTRIENDLMQKDVRLASAQSDIDSDY